MNLKTNRQFIGIKPFNDIADLEDVVNNLPEVEETAVKCVRVCLADNTEEELYLNEKFKGINNVSTGKFVNIVSNRYKLVQYKELFQPLVALLRETGLDVKGSALVYNDKVYLKVLFKDEKVVLRLDDKDHVRLGLLFGNSVDGMMSLFAEALGYRKSCANDMLLGNYQGFKQRQIHLGEDIKLYYKNIVENLLELSPQVFGTIKSNMNRIIFWPNVEKVLYGVGFGKNSIASIMETFENKDFQSLSSWDLYNQVTYWSTHTRDVAFDTKRFYHTNAMKILTSELETLIIKGEQSLKILNVIEPAKGVIEVLK